MSSSVTLQTLLQHPPTLERVGVWVEALKRNEHEQPWDTGWLSTAQPVTDPLAEPLGGGGLELGAEGKMFGVLCGVDEAGEARWLRAFSGQLHGAWLRRGWAPPLFEPSAIARASLETQTRLHLINRMIAEGRGDRDQLKRARREASRALTAKLIEAYTLSRRATDRGLERRSLSTLWPSAPLGAGDCCAPKLLCWAARLGLTPVGLAEVWWGPACGAHLPGQRYAPCAERCAPLLPWLLGDK